MQCLRVAFNETTRTVDPLDPATPEPWEAVCKRFDNDVRRVMPVADRLPYTALYACFDADNRPVYYLVEEDAALARLRRRTFLSKLGRP